jgi:hypothetical protein
MPGCLKASPSVDNQVKFKVMVTDVDPNDHSKLLINLNPQ